jgi:hypothetical protein
MKILKNAVILIFVTGSLYSQLLYNVTQSFRVFPSDTAVQYEPVIVVSPLNPMVMFCSCNTYNSAAFFFSEGVYVTTNGGLNWFGNDICTGAPISNHGGDPGIAIDKNGVFLLKHIGNQTLPGNIPGVYVHHSSNMGNTWSSAYTLSSSIPPEDKGSLTTDNLPSSPYYGRTYITGVNYITPFAVLFAYTSNSGANWSSYSAINGNPPDRCSGGEIGTGPNGEVYNVWAAVTSSTPSTEIYAGFGKSTNGGVNWNISQNIFSMHGITGFLTQKGNIAVNGIPKMAVDLTSGPKRGWLYIVTNESNNSPAGTDPDIVFHRSTNGGQTWSQGIRVNQDPVNNGKIQYFPAICVDSTGAIDILYYDDRNTTSDSADVFMSRSTNGGNTWYDFEVSDKTFKPAAIIGFKQGDFIGLTSARNKLFPVWMANYISGRYQLWMTILDVDLIGIQKISTEVPKDFVLKQNYPNPFNPSTNIEFSVPKNSPVKLTIYNSEGKEVASPVNSTLAPGTYRTSFDGTNIASGIYFYRLTTQEFTISKKMILLK